jgi:hypothetical protein
MFLVVFEVAPCRPRQRKVKRITYGPAVRSHADSAFKKNAATRKGAPNDGAVCAGRDP